MWSFAGLYSRVLLVGLLLASTVLAGEGAPEREYAEKSRDSAMALQSKVWWLFAGSTGNREYQDRESPDSLHALRQEPEGRGKSGLSSLADQAETRAPEDERERIEKQYRSALARAKADYQDGKSRISELKRQAGLGGLGFLFVGKEKQTASKSIAAEQARVELQYRQAKEKATADYREAQRALRTRQSQPAAAASERVPRIGPEEPKGELKPMGGQIPPATQDWYLVSDIVIDSNSSVFPKNELLKDLPEQYPDEVTGKPYDFKALRKVLGEKKPVEVEVSKRDIQGLMRYILAEYEEKGYAGIYVYVPQDTVDETKKKFKNGTLVIRVVEGKVAEEPEEPQKPKVCIERYHFEPNKPARADLKDSKLITWSGVKPGQPINKRRLDYSMNLLNLNPDRHIDTVVSRSIEPDAVKLTYKVHEASPWHWYTQVDDSGTDERQWAPRVGLVNTNLTGRDDRFSFMYQAPVDSLNENNAFFGSYDFPLFTPRLRLGFYAGYSQFEITPETAGGGVNFRGDGSFYGTTLRYNLLQWPGHDPADKNPWFLDIIGSLSHERSKVKPSLGMSADVDMDLYEIGAQIHRSTKSSKTSFKASRFETFDGSDKSEFAKARVNADPDFAIYTLSASHTRFIDPNGIHELGGSVRSVTSSERLIPAKMTTFGGLYTVRGYEEDEIVADGGIIASAQYKFNLSKFLDVEDQVGSQNAAKSRDDWPPKVSLLAFVDHGRAKIKNPVPGETRARDLWGAGLGATVEMGDKAYGGFYYSWPLRGTNDTDRGEGRWNFDFRRYW